MFRLTLSTTVFLVCSAAMLIAQTARAEDGGPGVNFRVGHMEGQGVSQYRSTTPIELFPYLFVDDSLLFADVRAYVTNDLNPGGNIGVGYRYYSESFDRLFGASLWYDADYSREVYLHQVGVSLETLAGPFDVRGNVYIPVGETTRELDPQFIAGSAQFTGNSLTYGLSRSWFTAMAGGDAEVGAPIPGEFADAHGIRVYGGAYHFAGDDVENITGISGRVQANIIAGLDAEVRVTNDAFYETRAFVALAWTFGALHRSQRDQDSSLGRIGEHVTRNTTVVAPGRHLVERLMALNPGTGSPWSFAHVSSFADSSGDGTADRPFNSIAAAQATGLDVVFVHAGSVFNGSAAEVILRSNQRLFGDASNLSHALSVQNGLTVPLPHPVAGDRPVLNASPGNTLTLANAAEVSGFSILNASADAIAGDGVNGVTLRNIYIDHPSQAGIRLINSTNVSMRDAIVSNAGIGIAVDGGNGSIQFEGLTAVDNAVGPAVSLRNLISGAQVTFDDLTITNRHGRGIEIANVAGDVRFEGTILVQNEAGSTASALDIQDAPGNFTFIQLDVNGATGDPGVNLEDNLGTTSFGHLNVNSHDGTALRAANAGALAINGTVDGAVDTSLNGTLTAVNGTALDVQSTDLNVNLKSVSSSNAPIGIRLVNTTGAVGVYGTGGDGSGGTIENTTTAVFLQNTGAVGLQSMVLNANGTGIRAESVSYLAVRASEIQNSTGYGIDTLNATGVQVANTSFSGNGAPNIRSEYNQVGSYGYLIDQSTLVTATGENIAFRTLAGGEGATLNLTVDESFLQNSLAGSTGLLVDWEGTLNATLSNSTVEMNEASIRGVRIENSSTQAMTTLTASSNTFFGGGTSNEALFVSAPGPIQLSVTNNAVNLGATSSTAFRLALGTSASATLTGNSINDFADGGSGILFDTLTGPGNVTLSGNVLNFANTGGLLDRGIIFTAVDTTNGLLQLSGTSDNSVFNADTLFFAPLGATSGSVLVNGTAAP